MQTHIYIAISPETIRRCGRYCSYMITADGSERTVFGMITADDSTMNAATLEVLTGALERFRKPCDIALHAKNAWALNMIDRNLETWAKADFRTADGKEVANRELWQRIHEAIKDKRITIHPGRHEYSSWMLSEMVLRTSKHE